MSGITADLAQSPAPVKKRGKIRRVIGVVLIAVVLFLMVSTLIVMRQRIESADEAAGAIYNHVLWNNLIIGIAFLITAIGIGFDISDVNYDENKHFGINNIKYRIDKMCGGVVIINSEVGRGTDVTVYFFK